MKYPERISSSFAREELIGKFRPGEISAAELPSSSMPRHADSLARGEGNGGDLWRERTSIFALSFPEVGETRHGESPEPSLPHFPRYIKRNAKFSRLYRSNERKGDANFIYPERNVFLVGCHRFRDKARNAGAIFEHRDSRVKKRPTCFV